MTTIANPLMETSQVRLVSGEDVFTAQAKSVISGRGEVDSGV